MENTATDKNLWELLKLCLYWVSEKQNNRFMEEASWFGLDISNEDSLYSDLLNFEQDDGLQKFLDENGFGITRMDLNEIMPSKIAWRI